MIDVTLTAKKYENYIKQVRWHFHRHPEPSGKEFETSAFIKKELTSMGVQWRPCGMPTGVLAEIQGCAAGKTILLRADMDALDVKEMTGAENASENEGVMHACGHDCHIAMLMTAVKIIYDLRGEFAGRVLFAFQPAEEIGKGAASMVEDGAMENVDACFGMHVWPEIETGKVSLAVGPRMASADRFFVQVQGKGGHGAIPHTTVDALTTACEIVSALQTLVSREINSKETAVVTVGKLTAGTRFNVVAETATLEGTTRAFSHEVRNGFEEAIRRISEGVAAAHRAKASVRYDYVTAPVINDATMAHLAQKAAVRLMGEKALSDYGISMVGEDFSAFLAKAPGVFAFLGVRGEDAASHHSLHSGCFLADEKALLNGAKLAAQVAMDFLQEAK